MCVSFSPHLHYSAPPSHSLCPTSAPAQSGQYTLMALPAGSGAFTVRALHQEASVKGKVQSRWVLSPPVMSHLRWHVQMLNKLQCSTCTMSDVWTGSESQCVCVLHRKWNYTACRRKSFGARGNNWSSRHEKMTSSIQLVSRIWSRNSGDHIFSINNSKQHIGDVWYHRLFSLIQYQVKPETSAINIFH